jgi:hypothetical protein
MGKHMKKRLMRNGAVDEDKDELAYRALVESTSPSLPNRNLPLEEMYLHFGLSWDNSLSLTCVTDHLYAQIAADLSFVPNVGNRGLRLQALKHQLLLKHFAEAKSLQPYLAFLDVIMDATRKDGWVAPPLEDNLHWRAALVAAANFDLLNPSIFRDRDVLVAKSNARQLSVASAIKRLRTLGYKIAIIGGKAIITYTEEIRIAERIELSIQMAGGLEFAASVFRAIRPRYDSTQERYHIVRSTGTAGRTGGPSLPIAYLLNLCVKNSGKSPKDPTRAQAAARDAIGVATAYAATFDIEPYNTWETLFNSGSSLPHFLQEIAVYDGMFNLVQWRPSATEKLLKSLFDWHDAAAASHGQGWTVGQAALVARTILKLARGTHGPFGFTRGNLATRIPVLPPAILSDILDVFAHRQGIVNREYRLPYEQAKVNFGFKPLIEQAPGEYILMDPSWCAPGFYEAILGFLRDKHPDADKQVGRALERFIRSELRGHGVDVASGQYSIAGEQGECDAVVETSDRIIIIEMKKKSLTRQSRSGSCVSLFSDLAESLLAAQLQVGKHEILLYRHGIIDLLDVDSGTNHRVERRDRAIERVALSLPDFGAIQDRGVLSQILETARAYQIATDSPRYAEQVAKVQKKGQSLADQYNDLAKLRPEPRGAVFMNCWFLSLGHLLVMLEGVTSNNSFQKSLFNTRHIIMGSLDLYYEHAQALALRAHQEQ